MPSQLYKSRPGRPYWRSDTVCPPELGSFLQYEVPYFPLTCSPQLLARPSPLRNDRAASTIWGARPIS